MLSVVFHLSMAGEQPGRCAQHRARPGQTFSEDISVAQWGRALTSLRISVMQFIANMLTILTSSPSFDKSRAVEQLKGSLQEEAELNGKKVSNMLWLKSSNYTTVCLTLRGHYQRFPVWWRPGTPSVHSTLDLLHKKKIMWKDRWVGVGGGEGSVCLPAVREHMDVGLLNVNMNKSCITLFPWFLQLNH